MHVGVMIERGYANTINGFFEIGFGPACDCGRTMILTDGRNEIRVVRKGRRIYEVVSVCRA